MFKNFEKMDLTDCQGCCLCCVVTLQSDMIDQISEKIVNYEPEWFDKPNYVFPLKALLEPLVTILKATGVDEKIEEDLFELS